ncbi:MAG: UDP-3-O-(3-hydroxymyristoyl)glucosamine N-acyltransferase [Castellaniella sp.]
MPVLLAPDQAPTLKTLLEQSNGLGLKYRIIPEQAAGLAVRGLGSLSGAGNTEISFLANPRLAAQLQSTQAAVVVMTPEAFEALPDDPAPGFAAVLCDAPYAMYAMLAQWFESHRLQGLPTGVHPTAVIHPSARLEDGVSVGPFCIIEAGVRIGRGTRLGAHVVLGEGCSIGCDSLLHARVTLYHGVQVGDRAILHSGAVLGADGFGFAPAPDIPGAWVKIAQLGRVIVGDDVEIGANTTVDRGALDATRIGNGVKLDNQIMIGHNVEVGDHTAMAACVGVAGSTRIGARCTIGGAAMLSGHLTLGDDVHISGGTAVTSNVARPGRYTGVFPLASHRDWQKNAAVLAQLAGLRRRLRQLEAQQRDDAAPADSNF